MPAQTDVPVKKIFDALSVASTGPGGDVLTLSRRSPVLLVFLRHMGCTFCREAMADIAVRRAAIEGTGTRIVLVHMSDRADAERVFAKYPGLIGVLHVSNPGRALYQSLGLRRGSLWQLFGFKSVLRGFRAGLIDGHLVGRLMGDGFQMPGVFLIRDGRVVCEFRHASAADRPDYDALGACPV